MALTKVKLGKKLKCLRCGHEWLPRTEDVFTCPKTGCRSPYWNVPKTMIRKKPLPIKELNDEVGKCK